jgi:hypothetical protein
MKLYVIVCVGCMALLSACTRKAPAEVKTVDTGPEVTMCNG